MKFCLLNTRSIRNKSTAIKEFVLESKIDILALTETWLDDCDEYSIRDIIPANYVFKHIDRASRGGGVGLLYNKAFVFKFKRRYSFKSFEIIDMTMTISNPVRIVVVYRPPPSTQNGLTHEIFFTEFRSFLEQLNNDTGRIILSGDFNFHVDDKNNIYTKKFLDLITIFNLKQHVNDATHVSNHTLDLILTRYDNCDIVNSISVIDPGISDHYSVMAKICLKKPNHQRREVSYRNLKSINYDNFCSDISNSSLALNYLSLASATDVMENYDDTLKSILDLHAPIKKKIITLRPASPWYTHI